MLGDEESHFVVELHTFGFGLLLQDGDAHFQFRRFDLYGQTPVETGYQTVVEAVDILRIGIAGDDDLLAGFDQGVEQEEEFFLRAVLAVEELHVVEQQHIQRTVG